MQPLPEAFPARDLFAAHCARLPARPFMLGPTINVDPIDVVADTNLGLQPGEMLQLHLNADASRRVLVVGTPVGNLVIFERQQADDWHICVAAFPYNLTKLCGETMAGPLSYTALHRLVGRPHTEYNLGRYLAMLYRNLAA